MFQFHGPTSRRRKRDYNKPYRIIRLLGNNVNVSLSKVECNRRGGTNFLIQIKLFGLKSPMRGEIIYLGPRCAVT